MITVILLVVAAIVVVGLLIVASRRRSSDGVDSFRRQIDALSPEARRPVVDQVQSVAETNEPESAESDSESGPDDARDGDDT